MLTRKQYELLIFINRRLSDGGVSPSFEEMKDALGLKSEIRHPPPHQRARGARLHPPPAAPRPRPRSGPPA